MRAILNNSRQMMGASKIEPVIVTWVIITVAFVVVVIFTVLFGEKG